MSDTTSQAPKAAAPRRLLLLAFTIVFGVFFGIVAIAGFSAWTRGALGDAGSLAAGAVFAWILPLVLSVRAALALKRQKRPLLLRRIAALFLVVTTQFTVFLVGITSLETEIPVTAQLAAAIHPVFGSVPVLGGILEKSAKDGGARLSGVAPVAPTTPAPTTPTAPTPPTAGPTAPTPTTPAVPGLPGLSPRTAGRTISTVGAVVTTSTGDLAAARFTLAFGGATTARIDDLSAFSADGSPTRVETSSDGHIAIVLAGQVLLTASPDAAPTKLGSLSRGAKLGELEVQGLRDVAVGPGGHLLASIDAFDAKKNAVVQALVAAAPGSAPVVVRRAGDVVDAKDKTNEGSTSHAFSIKRNDGSGPVVVEEVMLVGGNDLGEKFAGTEFVMNPRRLLVGRIDAPRALSEIVRTGDEVSGIEGVTLQAFGDAVALPDGRVVFDANFVEDGVRGWLFQARLGGGAFAVAPELVGKPEAPFAERGARTVGLSVEADGHLAFVNKEGAMMRGTLAHLVDTKATLLRAEAIGKDGQALGGVSRVLSLRMTTGGEWVLARVEVLAADGARHEALVLASQADLTSGKIEALLSEGGTLTLPAPSTPAAPTPLAPAAAAPRSIKSLFVLEGHDEALWSVVAP